MKTTAIVEGHFYGTRKFYEELPNAEGIAGLGHAIKNMRLDEVSLNIRLTNPRQVVELINFLHELQSHFHAISQVGSFMSDSPFVTHGPMRRHSHSDNPRAIRHERHLSN